LSPFLWYSCNSYLFRFFFLLSLRSGIKKENDTDVHSLMRAVSCKIKKPEVPAGSVVYF
jgi:hypothetical protein